VLLQKREFWIELVSFMVGSDYDSHLFELPGQDENLLESMQVFHDQTVVAEDDGRFIRITLREARMPEFEQILAVLAVTTGAPEDEADDAAPEGGGGDAGAVTLPAESVVVDKSRRELRLQFPSLIRWQLLAADEPPPLTLRLTWSGETLSFNVLHREVEPIDGG
jgi:hypothetical protein